ncbi:MAG: CBS domain-containing protein [Candidatus Zixiibacteriota bacterium]|nr:MAG: CBS domain-containing protein [candidate division Zixibacteria bacterium]
MKQRGVKELMLPLDEYAVVHQEDTLLDAVLALEKSQSKLPPGLEPHRAVLVVDAQNRIVGKLGHLAFLKALEPKYSSVGDLGVLSQVGLSTEFIQSMMENMNLWKDSLEDVCRRARTTRVREVMRPVTESVDENATLGEALHKIIVWQTLSLLVTRRNEVVGILRLSDLYREVANRIKSCAESG